MPATIPRMTTSSELFHLAAQSIPAGVNSPVRAFHGVGGDPIFIQSGSGPYLIDIEGKKYIDYVGSWGPLIVGHAHPVVVKEVTACLEKGFGFGAPTEVEVKLAQKVRSIMPAIDMIRFVNSGTEATMSAIRLARGFTKRNKIIKFSGCYHGHADSLLVAAGSGGLTFGMPNSAGVTEGAARDTLIADYNHLDQVSDLFKKFGDDIACVIVEPVAGNMNCVPPVADFLEGLRDLCDQYASVLIFDEVMTGFRVALGGAQAYYNVKPDLTTLGKVIGGGFPVGAFGGRKDIMQYIAPLGPVYQAGTLSGNPVAMTAGLATLNLISTPGFYASLTSQTEKLMAGFKAAANKANIPMHTHVVGSMFGYFFTSATSVTSETAVKQCDINLFKRFYHAMLAQGVYLAPSAFETGFVSSTHDEKIIQTTIKSAETALSQAMVV